MEDKGDVLYHAYDAEKRMEQQRCQALEGARLDREKAPLEDVRYPFNSPNRYRVA